MVVNDNAETANTETEKTIGIGKNDEIDYDNEKYDNNSNQSIISDDESFHEEMDWYHVLENHDSYTEKKNSSWGKN